MQEMTMPALGYEHNRGQLEVIMLLSTFASFLRHKRPELGRCCPHPAFTCIYSFGTLSLICKNSSSLPALCFVLSEPMEKYGVSLVPDAKSDAKLVHQSS